MKNMLRFAGAMALGLGLGTNAHAAVFVVAHPDDDILMMGPNLINDIRGNYPTVIIVVTAGDAGNGQQAVVGNPSTSPSFNTGQAGESYYRVRLLARQNALSTLIPASYARPWTLTEINFGPNTPRVERAVLGNVTEYRLNLPDRFDISSRTVVQNLLASSTYTAQDVRGFNIYTAATVRNVIRQIIKTHFPTTANLVINYQEPSPVGDVDHIDHTAVGTIVRQSINEQPAYRCMWQAVYPGYPEANNPVTFPQLVDVHRGAYEALHAVLRVQGNITQVVGGVLTSSNTPAGWAQTELYDTVGQGTASFQRQRGAMDAFHGSFYGKQQYSAIASTGPCNLGAN